MPQNVMDKREKKKIGQDIRVLADMTVIFCKENHKGEEKRALHPGGVLKEYSRALAVELCPECSRLVLHGSTKRIQCPMDPKPACKHCSEHCYQAKYREQVREVMRFSWPYLLKRGRLDLIARYM